MKDQLTGFGKKVWTDFRGFTAGQKAVTIAAIAALLVGGFMLATWKHKATYAPLYTSLSAQDASAIVDKLNSAGTPYQLADAGTEILVPQADVYSTRIQLSADDLPSSSQSNFPLLSKAGVTASQFQQQIAYQADVQNELASTIEAINGVQGATVNLAIPQQDVFNDGSQKPTAAVMLDVPSSTTLTTAQIQSITNLVSSSVPGMTADNVTVSDSNGDVLAAPGSGVSSSASAATQEQATEAYDNRVANSLQSMLDTALGAGNAVVKVNADLNFNQAKTTTNTYVTTKGNPNTSQSVSTEKYTGTGSGVGGALGTDTTTSGTTGTSGNGNYSKSDTVTNAALGTKSQTVITPPGQLQKLNVSVVVNKAAKGVNIAAITSLMKTGAGISSARGDQLSVQAIPFNTSNTTSAAVTAAAAAATAAAAHEKLMTMAKQGLLGVVVLGVLLATWLSSRKRRKANKRPPANDDVLGMDDVVEPAPLPEVELAPVVDIQDMAARRRALVALADEQPDDVARVLSGWLNTREA